MAEQQILTFVITDRWYAVDIATIKEICRLENYTSVPAVHCSIVGVLNLRGQVVTLFDVDLLMGREKLVDKRYGECLIVKKQEDDDDIFAIAIDDMGDVINVSTEQLRCLPEGIEKKEGQWLSGIADVDGKIYLMIDTAKIFRARFN